MEIEGMNELYKQLNALNKSLSPEVVEPLLMKAGTELKTAILSKIDSVVKTKTGNLKKGVKVEQMKRRGDNPRSVIVRPTAPHTYIIEHGTSDRYQKTTGRYTGYGPARPFFRPAVDENKERIYTEIVSEMKKSVESVCIK
jgi:HK97 gp10 family phage protein